MAKRYVMVILCAVAMCIAHAMRVNIAVTVVTILDKTAAAKVGSMKAITNVSSVRASKHRQFCSSDIRNFLAWLMCTIAASFGAFVSRSEVLVWLLNFWISGHRHEHANSFSFHTSYLIRLCRGCHTGQTLTLRMSLDRYP